MSIEEDRQKKILLKRKLPQPSGYFFVRSSDSPSDILIENHAEMQFLATELSTKNNPKTMALVKELCKDADPE